MLYQEYMVIPIQVGFLQEFIPANNVWFKALVDAFVFLHFASKYIV